MCCSCVVLAAEPGVGVNTLAKALGLQVILRSPQDKGTEFSLILVAGVDA